MLTPDEIERLEAFDGGGAPVLSVYLDLDPGRRVTRAYRTAFENLVKEAREPLPEPARAELAREAAAVAAWLEGQEPRGKGPGAVLLHATAIRAGARAGRGGARSPRVRAPSGRRAAAGADLATVELDITALEQGYTRPAEPACDVGVRVVPPGRAVPRAALRPGGLRRPAALPRATRPPTRSGWRSSASCSSVRWPTIPLRTRWLLEQCRAGAATHSAGAIQALASEIFAEYHLTASLPAFDAWLAAGAPSEDRG